MNAFAAAIEPRTLTMSALFQQHRMRIPELQRPFAWTTLQAKDLCSDLERVLAARRAGRIRPQHYFGSLVVVAHALEPDDIVDGQQRTTTISLLLGLIRHSFLELHTRCTSIALSTDDGGQRKQAEGIAAQVNVACDTIRNLLFDQKGFNAQLGDLIWEPKMSVSPEIKETYRSFLEGHGGSVPEESGPPVQALRQIAEYFHRNLLEPDTFHSLSLQEQYEHLDSLRDVVEHGLVMVRLATDSAESAFILFESLNARGVQLNVLDHLKVWMLATFAEHRQDEHLVASQMRAIAERQPDQQVKFFTDFYYARTVDLDTAYDGMKEPKHLALAARSNLFKDSSTGDGSDHDQMSVTERISFEIGYLTELWPFWRSLKDGGNPLPNSFEVSPDANWLRSRLRLLFTTLKHQQGYPYFMVAAERLRDRPDDFLQLTHAIEKFFFRIKTICGVDPGVISGMYKVLLKDLNGHDSLDLDLAKATMKTLLDDHASDSYFRARLLQKLGYGTPTINQRTKYFLQMLDEYSHPTMPWRQRVFDPSGAWHLEHIVPQNPQPGDPSLDQDEVDCIGNLCLLPPEINNRLSNLNYEEKQAEAIRLRDLPVPDRVVIDLSDAQSVFYSGVGPTWTSVDVQARIAALQDAACRIFTV